MRFLALLFALAGPLGSAVDEPDCPLSLEVLSLENDVMDAVASVFGQTNNTGFAIVDARRLFHPQADPAHVGQFLALVNRAANQVAYAQFGKHVAPAHAPQRWKSSETWDESPRWSPGVFSVLGNLSGRGAHYVEQGNGKLVDPGYVLFLAGTSAAGFTGWEVPVGSYWYPAGKAQRVTFSQTFQAIP